MKKKYIIIIISLCVLFIIAQSAKRSENRADLRPLPVEPDGGIGDGAVPLDELLETNKDYIGLSEEEAQVLAKENKVPFRVVERGGIPQPATKDYRVGRINASVQDGLVVSYDIEGEGHLTSKPSIVDGENLEDSEVKEILAGFDHCLIEGGDIMESYPRQCRLGNESFTEILGPEKKGDSLTRTFLVAPETVACVGVAPMECLLINGGLFYDHISGFDFEPGYEYVISVKQEKICDPELINDCPQDAGAYSYTHLETLSKTQK